jgi:hypothetical protein
MPAFGVKQMQIHTQETRACLRGASQRGLDHFNIAEVEGLPEIDVKCVPAKRIPSR